MPASRITKENGTPIFEAQRKTVRTRSSALSLDSETLCAFGELVVPESLWNALRQHAVWIEPVIESE